MPQSFLRRKRAPTLGECIITEAVEIAADACNVAVATVVASARSRADAAFARQLSMYLAHVVGGLPMGEIARYFARNRSTVGHACHLIEDRRDGVLFNLHVEWLEDRLKARLAAARERFAREGFPEFSPQRARLRRRPRRKA